jgi:hypothetical protein
MYLSINDSKPKENATLWIIPAAFGTTSLAFIVAHPIERVVATKISKDIKSSLESLKRILIFL